VLAERPEFGQQRIEAGLGLAIPASTSGANLRTGD
jgi:hypothetical protein